MPTLTAQKPKPAQKQNQKQDSAALRLWSKRPLPPAHLCTPRPPGAPLPGHDDDDISPVFEPAVGMADWVRAVFNDPNSPFYVAEHDHLISASIGYLWTCCEHTVSGATVAGTAEMPAPGAQWGKCRGLDMLARFFGSIPDFVVTFYAPLCFEFTDAAFTALCDHELCHCAQSFDVYGVPRFDKMTGRPLYNLKKRHDVEEFVGVVQRWGAGNLDGQVASMVKAAQKGPEFADANVVSLCGTCR